MGTVKQGTMTGPPQWGKHLGWAKRLFWKRERREHERFIDSEASMTYTTDPNDPRLTHGVDQKPAGQNDVYLILSKEERDKGFVRPVRTGYVHTQCGTETRMALALAETYAREPKFYGATYCVGCRKHRPVGEFMWSVDGSLVGS